MAGKSMQYLDDIVKSGLFQEIAKTEREKALDSLVITERRSERGSTLFFEGDDVEWLCILKSGMIRGEKDYCNGNKSILQIVDAGEIFALDGISTNATASMNYVCQEDCQVIFISWNSILKSRYCKEILYVLMQKLQDEYIWQMHQLEILSKRGIRERVMTFLEMRREKEGSNEIHIKMNRQQMAEYLCVNRSVLSKELSRMRQEGMIEMNKKNIVVKWTDRE